MDIAVAEDEPCRHRLDMLLYISLQRSCAVYRVVAVVYDILLCCVRQTDRQLLIRDAPVQILDRQIYDIANIVLGQRLEEYDLIQPVQKLRSERAAQVVHDHLSRIVLDLSGIIDALEQVLRADVAGHDDDRVLEVHGLAQRVGDTSVVQYLKQYVKYIRVRLLYLIKEHYRVRLSPDCLGQLSALVISDIAGRRSDQTAHGEFLHVLTHIKSDHIALIVKERLSQRLRQLRLAHAGRSQEEERTDRLARVLDACLASLYSLYHQLHSLVLTDDSLVELVAQMQGLAPL